jgi:hypothetical protein
MEKRPNKNSEETAQSTASTGVANGKLHRDLLR